MIELSILLITFNNEKYIEETLLSIIKQKVDFNYEIVVGEDCSTDNTLKILNQFDNKFPNLFKIKKNESQLGILRNFKATLDRCEGQYIFNLAGDDLLNNDYAFQKMVRTLKSNKNLGFVDTGFDKIYKEDSRLNHFSNRKIIEAPQDYYKKQLLLGRLTPIGVCFNKKHLYEFVDFDTYLNMNITIDDYPILVDLVMNTSFTTINESLHIYRVHNQSYSHTKSFENHYFLKNQMKNLFGYFASKYKYDKNLINTFNNNYYKELLFLCGYFEEKEIGKETYNMINSKSIKDHIHYFASQNSLFRKLVSII